MAAPPYARSGIGQIASPSLRLRVLNPLGVSMNVSFSRPLSSLRKGNFEKVTHDITNAYRYYHFVIATFRDTDTLLLWKTGKSRRISASLRTSAWKKLAILNAAVELENLRVPPGNKLEALKKVLKGQHSVRVNDQFRVCFVWRDNNAHNVETVDYH
jgi:toxin HigB-1